MLIWTLIIIGTIILDQITKLLAVEFLKPIDTLPLLKDALHLTYHENKGAAFGILQDHRWVFITISTLAIVGLLVYMFKNPPKNKWLGVGLSFIIGGGIGNMIDRTLAGFVVDFIDFRLINFAIFNVADSFVCIGASLITIYIIFFYDEKRAKELKNDSESEG